MREQRPPGASDKGLCDLRLPFPLDFSVVASLDWMTLTGDLVV